MGSTMKGMFWHDASSRWAIYIGYRHTKAGTRTRAVWYFAGNPAAPSSDIIADAVGKQREWKAIVASWPEVGPQLAKLDPDNDYTLPVWYDPDLLATPIEAADEIKAATKADADYLVRAGVDELKQVATWGQNHEQLITYMRAAGLLPKSVVVATRHPSIREAIRDYIAEEQRRITLKIGRRIDTGTFNTSRNNLLLCVGLPAAKEWFTQQHEAAPLIDVNKPLVALDANDLRGIANYWFTLPGDVKSRRTVKNYFAGLKAFLAWAESQDELGFVAPKNTLKILHINDANEPNVTATDYPLLVSILKDAPERTRMYALLGLTCGFYQSDICKLLASEIEHRDGQMFITGFRSKEDSEAKTRTKIKLTHWVAPEIAEMMKRHKARQNPHGFYFLNRYGQPMCHEKVAGGKTNAVRKAWDKVASGKLDFRQLRKWTWNDLQRHGNDPVCRGETLAKRWAGQQGGGVSRFYQFNDYLPVHAAQQAWWGELKPLFGF